MFEALRSIISRTSANYGDIRYEIKKETKIMFNGKELYHVGSNSTDGYVIRILKNGGLSSIAFTRPDDADMAVHTAEENAALTSHHLTKPVEFAITAVVKDTFLPDIDEDPRSVSIDEKLRLTENYNSIPLKYEKIATTNVQYSEVIREKYFVSTEGTEVREDLITTTLGGMITSRDGALTQNVRVAAGGSQGFASLRFQEEEFERKI